MADVSTTAGAKIYIGTTVDAPNISAFKADSYTEIKEVEDLGEFGDESSEVEFTLHRRQPQAALQGHPRRRCSGAGVRS